MTTLFTEREHQIIGAAVAMSLASLYEALGDFMKVAHLFKTADAIARDGGWGESDD